MGRLQPDLESAQQEREEKERALMEAMANIHVKEHEAEENDIGENGEYGEEQRISLCWPCNLYQLSNKLSFCSLY